jgi:tetratricopeptide (TPR) repeat protein
MPGYRSPLDAYRDDLARAHGKKRLAAGDEFWIILSTGLRRLSQAPTRSRAPAARRLAGAIHALATGFSDAPSPQLTATPPARADDSGRPAAVAAALARYGDEASVSAIVTQVRGAAADAEEAGAVVLAREMLTDLAALTPHATPLDRGMVLIQLGRIARTLGNLDSAFDLVTAAGDIGRSAGVRELEVRESAAKAILARTRGNYPEARRLFETALEGATDLGLADVTGGVHQGLMIVTAEAGDFDTALFHGWQALSVARTEAARAAEVLGNLAQLCAKAGYDAAALGGFTAALARANAPRLRLPYLAGIVRSAARLGDVERVGAAERLIAAEANDAFPFETAGAWFAVARARRALGDASAGDAAARRAATIAHVHGFYEIAHRLETEIPIAPAPLAPGGMGVIRSLEAWTDSPPQEPSVFSTAKG